MAEAYPLSWPAGWPRTKFSVASKFKVTLSSALENVQGSLRRFGKDTGKDVKNVIISSNYTLGDVNPTDGGVAVYFRWDDVDACIAVDLYGALKDNLQAIHHILEAERTKMRHGGLNIVRTSFRGYTALPPSNKRPWREILGLPQGPVALANVEARHRDLAKRFHPDVTGGPGDKMAELNQAIADARQELSRS